MSRDLLGGVLCAGFGSRLEPLTDVLPKPLLPFLNTPIIAYALERLKSAQIERVAINLHHLRDAIPPVVDRLAEQFGMHPVYAIEWEILGSGGGIRGLLRAHGDVDGTLVVLNGDSVMDADLDPHIQAHRDSERSITLLTRPKAEDQPGRIFVDKQGVLQGIRDYRRPSAPPDSALIEHDFTGVHIVETPVLLDVPLDYCDIIDTLYGPLLEADGAIGVSEVAGFWAALDSPRLMLETAASVLRDSSRFKLAPLPPAHRDGLWFYGPDSIDDQAEFAPPVFLGLNTVVEAGAKIGPNVVADGVTFKAGTCVSNAILYGMGEVEGEWRDCVAIAGQVAPIE